MTKAQRKRDAELLEASRLQVARASGLLTDDNKPKTGTYNFTLSPERLEQMQDIRERVGIPIAEQIRRGIDLWLKQQEAGR